MCVHKGQVLSIRLTKDYLLSVLTAAGAVLVALHSQKVMKKYQGYGSIRFRYTSLRCFEIGGGR